MYSSLRMTTFIPFLLTIFVSTIIAYPAKIDPNEAFYFNRFHYFPDGYDGKDVRNLDGIDQRGATYEDYGMRLVDRTNGNSGGGDSTEYRLHNPLSLLFAQTPSDSSMHIDGIGGGHLVRNLASAARQGGEPSYYALARTDPDDGDGVANRFKVVDLYRAFVSLDKVNGNDETDGSRVTNPNGVSRNPYILELVAPKNDAETDHTNDDTKTVQAEDLDELELKSAVPMAANTFRHPFECNHKLFKRDLDALGGGHLLRSLNFRDLDALGGGHLLRSLNLDVLRDGHFLHSVDSRDLDALGGGHLLKRLNKRDLDSIGGGNLLRSLNARELDALGGGNLLRSLQSRDLDGIGGGHLLRSLDSRDLDGIGGGNLLRSLNFRDLDAIGGGNLLRSLSFRDLDALGGGHLLRSLNSRDLDALGGGHLLRSLNSRDLDALGGGHLLRSLNSRDLDALGGGHLLRSLNSRDLDALGGGHLLRSLNSRDLDAIGGGNLLRSLNSRDLDSIGGGNLLRSLEETKS